MSGIGSLGNTTDVNPWPIIATTCLGMATLTLYSAYTAKRVKWEETAAKLKEAFEAQYSRELEETAAKLKAACEAQYSRESHYSSIQQPKSPILPKENSSCLQRSIVRLMNSFKSSDSTGAEVPETKALTDIRREAWDRMNSEAVTGEDQETDPVEAEEKSDDGTHSPYSVHSQDQES